MGSPDKLETHGRIFGNGLKPDPSPGVDRKNWRYIPEENNYAYIGKPDRVRRMPTGLKQVVNQITQTINKVA